MFYIILLILLFLYISINYQEGYSNIIDCSDSKDKHKCLFTPKRILSKCPSNSVNPGEKCYQCQWTSPNYSHHEDNECCIRKCYRNIKNKEPYYCQKGLTNECVKKYAKNKKSRYCGYHQLFQTPAKIYDKYNDCLNGVNKYRNLSKEQCLQHQGAGWCTDYLGEGKCVPGSPTGPTNLLKYYQCYPNQRGNKNAWTFKLF